MFPVWAGHISKKIYQASATSNAAIENARGLSTRLSGWLVDPNGLARDREFPYTASHQNAASSKMDYLPWEIGTNPKTGTLFHWKAFQDMGVYGTPLSKMRLKVQSIVSHRWLAETVWALDIHTMLGTSSTWHLRTAPVPANPMMDQRGLRADIRRLVPTYSVPRLGHPATGMVGISSGVSRIVSQDPRHRTDVIYGRCHPGMGSSACGPQYQEMVVYSPEWEPHQYFGNGSRYLCSQRLSQQIAWLCGPPDVWQRYCSVSQTSDRRPRPNRSDWHGWQSGFWSFVIANGLYWYHSICRASAMFK